VSLETILFGNMCSGKTSVAQILKNDAKVEVVSAKDLIERHARKDVAAQRARGELLPDGMMIEWVGEALKAALATGRAALLDGFPRTEAQARWLAQNHGRVGRVVHLDFDLAVLRRRFENRVLCAGCPMPYSRLFTDFAGVCACCGSREFRPRPTDRPDYFEVKTTQFRTVSLQVLPVLRAAGFAFASIGDHSTFAGLRSEARRLHGD
jgi:adenylate kinase